MATAYPAYSPREGRVITLEDRVLNCFMRSCNGVRPPLGSEVSIAVTTYITWLSQGQGMRMNPKAPLGPNHVPRLTPDPAQADSEEGRSLYEDRCSSCHGSKGGGTKKGPAVWGPRSYNAGAGLATLNGLTSWLKVAMPLDDADLTTDEARDVAAYILTKPRPRFVLRDHLPLPEARGVYNSDVLDEVQEIKPRE
ncbi:MAG: c-type cytochrome [Isosphaeraceae bacterium]